MSAGRQMQWSRAPSGLQWDPASDVAHGTENDRGGRLVRLGSLLADVRQGIFAASFGRGEIPVRTLRVSDIHPELSGSGEVRFLHGDSIRRHLLAEGDVLVARVGRLGRAACVMRSAEPQVPSDGILVARPTQKEWGPALAATLSTPYVREYLRTLFSGSRFNSLTREQLGDIRVPSPRHVDFSRIGALVREAGELVRVGSEVLDRVRGEVEICLEGAPSEPTRRASAWISEPGWLSGWGWADVQKHLLTARRRLRAGHWIHLHDAVVFGAHRAKTVVKDSEWRTLENDDVRPDWYMVIPNPTLGHKSTPKAPSTRASRSRFFEIDRECLLIPTVGNIASPPVVIPASCLDRVGGRIRVPISWLPIQRFRHPRAMAVVLDSPFLRLQRRLAGAVSTVPHITRDDLRDLVIPAVPEEIWHRWESDLLSAQSLFIEADSKAKHGITIAEGWYA